MKAEKTADQQTPRKMWRRAFAPMPVVLLLGLLVAATMLPPLAFSAVLARPHQPDPAGRRRDAGRGNRGRGDRNGRSPGSGHGHDAARSLDCQCVERRKSQGLLRCRPHGVGWYRDFLGRRRQVDAATTQHAASISEKLGKASNTGPVNLALDTGAVVVSDALFGKVADRWVFNVVLPWKQRGEEPMALMLTQNAEALGRRSRWKICAGAGTR